MNYPATPSDLFNFPSNFKGDMQIFHANNQSTINFQQWIKPRGTSMSFFIVIGGGGGGGGGHQKTSGNNGSGGGGGGAGGMTKLLIPSFLLPNTLYIQVGVGGLGGAGGNPASSGGNGSTSYVLFSPLSYLIQNTLVLSGEGAASGGGAGASGAVGTAGTGEGSVTLSIHMQTGLITSIGAGNGGAGGSQSGGNGANVTTWFGAMTSGGAGGAGCNNTNFNGGNISTNSAIAFPSINFPTDAGAVAAGGTGGITSAVHGGAGVRMLEGPFLQSGGAGGGSNVAGTGGTAAGNGGNGGIGCGGGGGGAGVTAGRGGNGGNGLVAIFSW